MALPKLTATDEMKQIAASDLPRKEKTTYGYVREVCEYYAYLRCITQDGILKVAFFLPEHLRLNGSNPAYEVYLDKEKRQFITYNSLTQKWCESKLDRLDWKRLYWYAKTSWVSEEDMTAVQTYLGSDKKAVDAILQFQRDVRDEQLEQRHRRETDPWDKDMEQVPELPKDWSRWVDKVAIRQNYIYYHYKKGGAKTGYCTYCEKEVPIKVHPHHNQQGRCSCCRHPVVFKAYGRAGYMQTEKHFAYLIQRCKDGFVVREFQADRTYRKESLPNSKLYCQEIRRTIYDRERKPRTYYWGLYKQRNMRWISGRPCSYGWYGSDDGRVYGKTLPTLEQQELRCTGLVNWIRKQKSVDPEKYLAVLERIPQMEQISKANLPKLTKECFSSCETVSELIKNHSAGSLIKALGLDSRRFQRLRLHNGGCDLLRWLQYEKGTGREIPDNVLLWMCQQNISPRDVQFIADRMSMVQVYNYVRRQMPSFRRNSHEVLRTWEDYLSMAKKLHMDVYDEIVYRTRKLRRRHDDLVLKCQEKDIELQAEEMEEKFPHVNAICQEIKAKYEYADADYMVMVPSGILDIITNGRRAFAFLVEKKEINLWEFFKQHRQDGEDAPQLKLLREYALRISSWRCFRFVERLLAEYTFSQLQTIFGKRFYFHECFVRSEGYYSRREYKTYISRPFLSAEQHRQLYDWVERSFFQTEPEKYEDFVLSALKAPEIQRLYDKKALAAVLRQFLLHSEYNGYEINRLKETFYSKEELEDERRVEAERKKQEKRLEQEKRTIQKREKLQQLYNGSAESLVKFIGGYYYRDEKKEVLDMTFDKLVEWPAGCVQTMDAKDAHAFFELCGELVESEPRPRHEILNMVLTMIGGEAA